VEERGAQVLDGNASEEAGMEEENDLQDTASSPIKPGQRTEDMEEDS
jgi:hypothetical protein